jgi:hypothetical protein
MVTKALMLPDAVVEEVARRHGEASIAAVRETYSEEEIDRLQRRARDEEMDVTVLAALDEMERERVEHAASEAGEHPSVWLMQTTLDVMENEGATAGPETLGEKVERAILQRTEIPPIR